MHLFWENISLLALILGRAAVLIIHINTAIYMAVFWLLEKARPVEPNQPASTFLLNLRIGMLSLSMRVIYAFVFAMGLAVTAQYFPIGLIDLRFSSGWFGQIVVGLLSIAIADSFAYWMHRCQHAVPFLWAFHKIHHADRHMSVATTTRHHLIEHVVLNVFVYVPMALLFKLDPMPSGILGTLMSWSIFFNHANLKLEMGWLTKVLGGPQLHRIHHSILPEHFDKNFTQTLPLWDLLFGTYYHPKTGEWPSTGLDGEEVTGALQSAVMPFRPSRAPMPAEG